MNKHQRGRVRLTVSYGYDVHSIEVPSSTWLQIQGGEAVTVQGQGFSVDGKFSQDEWAFNVSGLSSLQVTAEDAFEVFDGVLANISVEAL